MTRYLPISLRGVKVLRDEGDGKYRVDNSQLNSKFDGVQYRLSKNLDDKEEESSPAAWGTTVSGFEDGDAWIRVKVMRPKAKCANEQNDIFATPRVSVRLDTYTYTFSDIHMYVE